MNQANPENPHRGKPDQRKDAGMQICAHPNALNRVARCAVAAMPSGVVQPAGAGAAHFPDEASANSTMPSSITSAPSADSRTRCASPNHAIPTCPSPNLIPLGWQRPMRSRQGRERQETEDNGQGSEEKLEVGRRSNLTEGGPVRLRFAALRCATGGPRESPTKPTKPRAVWSVRAPRLLHGLRDACGWTRRARGCPSAQSRALRWKRTVGRPPSGARSASGRIQPSSSRHSSAPCTTWGSVSPAIPARQPRL